MLYCIWVLKSMLTLKGIFSTGLSEKIDTPIQHLPPRDLNWLVGMILSRTLLGYTDMLVLCYRTINLHILVKFWSVYTYFKGGYLIFKNT